MKTRDMKNPARAVDPSGTRELGQEEMREAAGGIWPCRYSKSTYHSVGISTSYHVFAPDIFSFMGRTITHSQANEIVATAKQVSCALNAGNQCVNRAGSYEKNFMAAFNSQLHCKYGITWNGTPGTDF